jgi:hypothetical protein
MEEDMFMQQVDLEFEEEEEEEEEFIQEFRSDPG